ncbi:MAG: major capsid protein [Reinekea sp.]
MPQLINPLTSYFDGVYSDLSNIKVSKLFLSIWANAMGGARTEYVDNATQVSVDLYRGYKKISKVLSRGPNTGHLNLGENSKHIKADYWQNVAYDFPLIQDSASVSYSNLLKYRAFGRVDTDVSMSPMDKAREELGRDLLTIIQGQGGRMEAMCVEALSTGVLTLDDDTEYDFDRSTDNTITVNPLWSVTATADPIGDFDIAIEKIQENGKSDASAAIIGYDAFDAMINTDQIKNLADNRRFEFVQMGSGTRALPGLPTDMNYLVANGAKYIAYIKTKKGRDVYLFAYNDRYQNAAGTWVDFFNSKDVLVFDHTARRDRYFGPRIRFDMISQEEMMLNQALGLSNMESMAVREADPSGILDVSMFHFDSFMNRARTNIYVECYTGFLPIPTAVDTTALLDGVIA